MFRHLFVNKLKILLKNHSMLFWTLIFPFVLGTFFYLALGNVGEAFEMKVIPIAVVDNENYQSNEVLKSVILGLSEKSDNQIFDTVYINEKEAISLLDGEKIDGYIIVDNDNNVEMVVKNNGINQTIIKSVLDEYYQMSNATSQAIEYNPDVIYNGVIEKLYDEHKFVVDASSENIDFSIHYFFTLIAMTCLYGSLIGLEVIKDCEANLSKKGARICMAPVNKFLVVVAGLLAGFIIQLIAILLLFLYLIFVFKVNFGNQVMPTVILSIVGCLAGTALGVFVGVSNRKSESFKQGMLIAVIMACCYFAGMMGGPQVDSVFSEQFPFMPFINPITIITNGLYSLFAYSTLDVYYNCVLRISVFTLILLALSYVFIRRKKYDSI